LIDFTNNLTGLTSLALGFMARIEGIPESELFERLNQKRAEIEKSVMPKL
jgi:hypothetical protein